MGRCQNALPKPKVASSSLVVRFLPRRPVHNGALVVSGAAPPRGGAHLETVREQARTMKDGAGDGAGAPG